MQPNPCECQFLSCSLPRRCLLAYALWLAQRCGSLCVANAASIGSVSSHAQRHRNDSHDHQWGISREVTTGPKDIVSDSDANADGTILLESSAGKYARHTSSLARSEPNPTEQTGPDSNTWNRLTGALDPTLPPSSAAIEGIGKTYGVEMSSSNGDPGDVGMDKRAIDDEKRDLGISSYDSGESSSEAMYWSELGCRSLDTLGLFHNNTGFYMLNASIGRVQCCQDGGSCTRTSGANPVKCLSGVPVSWEQARKTCQEKGLRLCSRPELLTMDASGCCGATCNMNNALVWTSTGLPSITGDNENFFGKVERLNDEANTLIKENKRMRKSYRSMIRVIQEDIDKYGFDTKSTTSDPLNEIYWREQINRTEAEVEPYAEVKPYAD